ncbi:MAG: AAA family ATPase [Planctomycetaceae bacterium]
MTATELSVETPIQRDRAERSDRNLPTKVDHAREAIRAIRARLNRALRGKADVVEAVLACLLAQGHLLIEDKPGLGKTTLAKALAAAIGGRFARVQCTPDLLPSDITGFSIFNQKTQEFTFHSGPVFADLLLADEINRATPRTQSALLEAMAERQVTVDGTRMPLSRQFFVIATQNPSEQHGTYPLPEAQLDRFAMKLSIGYPEMSDEIQMLRDAVGEVGDPDSSCGADLAPVELAGIQSLVQAVSVAESIQEYMLRLGRATRTHAQVLLGVSPRGLLLWQRVAQARAWLEQRDYVIPDDVRHVALPVLGVRLGTEQADPSPIVRELLETVAVPDYAGPRNSSAG